MIERTPSDPQFEDDFEALVSQLEEDANFSNRVESLNDTIDQNTLIRMFYEHGLADQERGPYFERAIDEQLGAYVTEFYRSCKIQGIDINQPYLTETQWDDLREHAALAMYNMRETLKAGDIVTAANAVFLRMTEGQDGGDTVSVAAEDIRIRGEVESEVIGQLPDDVSLFTFDDVDETEAECENQSQLPVGVGLKLRNVALVDEAGIAERLDELGSKAILVLGTLGLSVVKHYYQAEFLISDIPEDN